MYQDALVKLGREESGALLAEIAPTLDGGTFAPDTVTILGQELSFYPGYRFLEISDHESVPPARRFVVYKPGDVVVLDWTNAPLYRLNENVPLQLNDRNITDYVRFFLTYVKGAEGRFRLCESVDDINWLEDIAPAARQTIARLIQPMTVTGRDPAKGWGVTVCLLFKDALFRMVVHVSAAGAVSQSGEELLAENLPVLDDITGQ